MVDHAASAGMLTPVEARTFEIPQPKLLPSRESRAAELRDQPMKLPVAGARMLPGKDGKLYKAGWKASS